MQPADVSVPAPEAGSTGSAPSSKWKALKPWLLWFAGCMVFGWFLAIAWWAFLSPDAREAVDDRLVIPAGTADAIASGTGAPFVPSTLSLRPGGRLTVVNNDTAEHAVGNNIIPPGATAEITAPEDGSGGFACTIHSSGFIGVGFTGRPPFINTLIPALFIGVPLGLTAGAAAWIGRKLEDH